MTGRQQAGRPAWISNNWYPDTKLLQRHGIIWHLIVYLDMTGYRLNRSIFKAHSAKDAADHSSYYKQLSWQERLHIAAYLNSIAYNYPVNNPPRIDKTKFQAKSLYN